MRLFSLQVFLTIYESHVTDSLSNIQPLRGVDDRGRIGGNYKFKKIMKSGLY
jgi:hypothetical protein